MIDRRWNIFARELENVLNTRGLGLGHLDDRAKIHHEKVRRLQRSLIVPKSFPILNIEEMEQVIVTFRLTQNEILQLRAAILVTAIEEKLMDRINQDDALLASEQIYPIIIEALIEHKGESKGIGVLEKGNIVSEDQTDILMESALEFIDRATLYFQLGENANSFLEQNANLLLAESLFFQAVSILDLASSRSKKTETWNYWFSEATSSLRIVKESLNSIRKGFH